MALNSGPRLTVPRAHTTTAAVSQQEGYNDFQSTNPVIIKLDKGTAPRIPRRRLLPPALQRARTSDPDTPRDLIKTIPQHTDASPLPPPKQRAREHSPEKLLHPKHKSRMAQLPGALKSGHQCIAPRAHTAIEKVSHRRD